GRGPVDAFGGTGEPTENVAAADHHADLGAGVGGFLHVLGNGVNRGDVDAELALPHQRLARDLEQNPAVFRRGGHGRSLVRVQTFSSFLPAIWATSSAKSLSTFSMPSPTWKRTKPSIATGAPNSLDAFSITLTIWVSPSITKVCCKSTVSS